MAEQATDRRASEFNHEGHDGIRGKPSKVPLRVTSWPLWFMKLGHHRQEKEDPGAKQSQKNRKWVEQVLVG